MIYFLPALSKYFFGYFKNSPEAARFETGRADNARGNVWKLFAAPPFHMREAIIRDLLLPVNSFKNRDLRFSALQSR